MGMEISKISNQLNIRGILLSADVRATSYDEKDKETKEATGNKVEAISGRLKLITNLETKSTVTVEIFNQKYTKDGKVNNLYATLDDLVGGLKTNDEIKALKKKDSNYKNEVVIYDKAQEEPTMFVVSVFSNDKRYAPKFSTNRYVSNGEIKKNARISGGNVYIKEFDGNEENLYCDFEVDGITKSVKEEIGKDGEPTGRAVLNVITPIQDKGELDIVEIQYTVGMLPATENEEEYDLGGAVLDEVQEGDAIKLLGHVENTVKEVEVRTEVRLGRAKVTKRTERNSEYVVTGIDFVDEDIFDEDEMRDLIKEVNIREQEMLDNAGNEEEVQTRNTSRGMMGSRPTGNRKRNGFF